jgi:hypothetical protein
MRQNKAGVVDVRTDGEASGRLLAVRVESLHRVLNLVRYCTH